MKPNKPALGSREEFLRHYQTHSKEELLGHVADLHVHNLDMVKRLSEANARIKELERV